MLKGALALQEAASRSLQLHQRKAVAIEVASSGINQEVLAP